VGDIHGEATAGKWTPWESKGNWQIDCFHSVALEKIFKPSFKTYRKVNEE